MSFSSLQLLFRQSQLRRSIGSPSQALPPIFQSRNRGFSQTPSAKTSIGIGESLEHTATLGCYLFVDGKLMILTVNHLIPGNLTGTLFLTHISEQDRFEMTLPLLYDQFHKMLATNTHQCLAYDSIHRSKNLYEAILRFSRTFMFNSTGSGAEVFDVCLFLHMLRTECRIILDDKVLEIATLYSRSPTTQRTILVKSYGDSTKWVMTEMEMDWALFEITDSCGELQEIFSRSEGSRIRHESGSGLESGIRNELNYASFVKPEAFVRSLGRTSGHQIRQINTTLSAISHEGHLTQEWCVVKRPETPVEEWVEGGIGVEGDSGALIVDEETNDVYGMLWGRIKDRAATATRFTPLEEIFRGI